MTNYYLIYNLSLFHEELSTLMKIFSVDENLSKRLDFTATIERSGSFQRKHLEEQDMRLRKDSDYELSADLRDRQLEVLRVINLQYIAYSHILFKQIASINGAPRGRGFRVVESLLLELIKQHGFVDIKQFVTLCSIYFPLNNHFNCC